MENIAVILKVLIGGEYVMAIIRMLLGISAALLLLISVSHAQSGYLGVEPSDETNCRFYPMTAYTVGGYVMRVHRSKLRREAQVTALTTILDKYKWIYLIKDGYVMIPCEYYSDMEFIATASRKYIELLREIDPKHRALIPD